MKLAKIVSVALALLLKVCKFYIDLKRIFLETKNKFNVTRPCTYLNTVNKVEIYIWLIQRNST